MGTEISQNSPMSTVQAI